MAPPANRRPGYSRKAQLGLFLGYVVAVGGVFLCLGLLLVAALDPSGFALLRGSALDMGAPVSMAGRAVVRDGRGAWEQVSAYVDAGNQNHALRQELRLARRRLTQARALAFQNRRLAAAARLVETAPARIVTTRVIGSTLTGPRRLVTLSAGTRDGVRPGLPVRAAEGLIGRVVEVGYIAARAMLLTDPSMILPVRLTRTGAPALAAGRGDGTVELRALGAGDNPFRRGDIAVTTGVGGVYPPDIPAVVVLRRVGDGAIGRPVADLATLDLAIVEAVYQAPPSPQQPAPRR